VASTARSLSADFSPRLFDPGQSPDLPPPPTPWNPRWSIERYYEECYLPRVQAEGGRHPETVRKDRQAIQEFSWVCGALALGDFGAEHWLEFLRGQQEITTRGKRRAQNTLRNLATHARHVLREAALEEWRDAEGNRHVGLLQIGKLRVPTLQEKEPDDGFTAEEIGRAIACCRAEAFSSSYLPRGLSPKRFWPALLAFGWNTGFRPKTIFLAERAWIGQAAPGWLRVPKDALKHQSRAWEFYLNRAARRAVDEAAADDRHCFAWRGWPNTRPEMFAEHKRILLAAGLGEERAGYQFKGYRRALTNWLLTQLGDAPDLNVVRLVLGHRFQGPLRNYGRRAPIVVPLLDRLPQPAPHLPMCG
jgi:hypothetical protein